MAPVIKFKDKFIIGPTAVIREASTGLSFSARVDTGAKTCSLHVEEMEIIDKVPGRRANIGKTIRFLIKGDNGKTEWIETKIAGAVRIRSAAIGDGELDHRYKVRLTLVWNDFQKKVLVTLNDRTRMVHPLLLGRNYLRGDFLVDVERPRDHS